jgi:hypothetical protein
MGLHHSFVPVPPREGIEQAGRLMHGFAERTGLASERPARRYLWTDAFAVCNLLGLERATGEARYGQLALELVFQVHHTLGRHRTDDPRAGWLSGLDEEAGALHPTRGGLRIGKDLPERRQDEPFDPEREWDRDGQYFHYSTKWMHALDQVARARGQPRFNLWARELAHETIDAFTHPTPAGPRLMWKMSIDLSRPLVASMGLHDPLDGLITCAQLESTAVELDGGEPSPDLSAGRRVLAEMTRGVDWTTDDALGIGGLLMDACRVQQLERRAAPLDGDLLADLLAAALEGLRRSARGDVPGLPASMRLGFRELGLAIGLSAVDRVSAGVQAEPGRLEREPEILATLEGLRRHVPRAREIVDFWLEPEHRRAPTWSEHRDINEVMLATSLASEGVLSLFAPS